MTLPSGPLELAVHYPSGLVERQTVDRLELVDGRLIAHVPPTSNASL